MSSKVLIIYEYQILYELLDEIKENFSFKLIKSDDKHFDSLQFESNINYLVLVKLLGDYKIRQWLLQSL